MVGALPGPRCSAHRVGRRFAIVAAVGWHERLHVLRPQNFRVHWLQQKCLYDHQQLHQLHFDLPGHHPRRPCGAALIDALERHWHDCFMRCHGGHGPALCAGGRQRPGRNGTAGHQPNRRVGHRRKHFLLRLQLCLRLRAHRLGVLCRDIPLPVQRAGGRDLHDGELGRQLHDRAVHAHAPGGHPVQHLLRLWLLRLAWGLPLRLAPRDQGGAAGERPEALRRPRLVLQDRQECRGLRRGGKLGPHAAADRWRSLSRIILGFGAGARAKFARMLL
mmetsp:Transcript_21691/g.60581  ORF Transcript_21691/g.60581 Transcript_21691/m.60581 type:complete len:275 (+) Transcript_21691:952-1776(+)